MASAVVSDPSTGASESLTSVQTSTNKISTPTQLLLENLPENNFYRYLVLQTIPRDQLKNLKLTDKVKALSGSYKTAREQNDELIITCDTKLQQDSAFKIKQIGNIPVTVSPHPKYNISKGIVRDREFGLLSEDEIVEMFKTEGTSVIEAFKFKPTNNTSDRITVCLTFNQPELPSTITFGYRKFRVFPYIPRPRQCTKCYKYGHPTRFCQGIAKCSNCSSIECENLINGGQCFGPQVCGNCGGGHASVDKTCQVYNRERELLEIITKSRLSRRDAMRQWSVQNGNQPFRVNRPLYSTALKSTTTSVPQFNSRDAGNRGRGSGRGRGGSGSRVPYGRGSVPANGSVGSEFTSPHESDNSSVPQVDPSLINSSILDDRLSNKIHEPSTSSIKSTENSSVPQDDPLVQNSNLNDLLSNNNPEPSTSSLNSTPCDMEYIEKSNKRDRCRSESTSPKVSKKRVSSPEKDVNETSGQSRRRVNRDYNKTSNKQSTVQNPIPTSNPFELLSDCNDVHYFWRGESPFSNFHKCSIPCKLPGQFSKKTSVHSSEQLYQFRKAWYFKDTETCKEVLNAKNPRDCKTAGHDKNVKGFDTEIWKMDHGPAIHAMMEVLVRKFAPDSSLWTKLNDAPGILVEASPTDSFWGSGKGSTDIRKCGGKFEGNNMLGKLLVALRDYRRNQQNPDSDYQDVYAFGSIIKLVEGESSQLNNQFNS